MHECIEETDTAGQKRADLVLYCNPVGQILRVEHDRLSLYEEASDHILADLFDQSCSSKTTLFLKKISDAGVILDWECTAQLNGNLHPMKVSGILANDSLLIVADPDTITLQQILSEVSELTSIRGSVVSAIINSYGCSDKLEPTTSHLFNEIIRLSNQQAALHRELSKKTVELEKRSTELDELNQVLITITNGIQDSIMLLDKDAKILWANQTAHSGRREVLVGTHCHDFLGDTDNSCASSESPCPISAAIESGRSECGTHTHYDLEGTPWYSEVTVYPVRNHTGKIAHLVRISKDITNRKKIEDDLLSETLTDELTGIPNRRAFEKHLLAEWRRAARERSPLTIAMLDIDFFKNYNDLHGHQQGDTCLRKVAQSIKAALRRPGDLAARYGGEEFVVVLPGTEADNAITITNSIRQYLNNAAISHGDSSVSDLVTLSIGISTVIPVPEYSPEKLILSADMALYNAKHMGRNRVESLEMT